MEYEDVYAQYGLKKNWVKEDGKYHLLNQPAIHLFDDIALYLRAEKKYIVKDQSRFGLFDPITSSLILDCKYDTIYIPKLRESSYVKNTIVASVNESSFVYSMSGDLLSDDTFSHIAKVQSSCEFFVKDIHNKMSVISTCAKQFGLPSKCDSIAHVEEGCYILINDGKQGYFTSGGFLNNEVIIPFDYDEIRNWFDTTADNLHLLMARKGDQWLWIDTDTGQNKFNYTFDEIKQFRHSNAKDKTEVIYQGKKKYLFLDGRLEDR